MEENKDTISFDDTRQQEKLPKRFLGSLRRILIIVFSLIFLVCFIWIARYLLDSFRNNQYYDILASQMASLQAATTISPTTAVTDPSATVPPTAVPPTTAAPTEPQILPEYLPFYEQNNDMVGWITVPGTKVNYPVMQTPDNHDYYLNRDFNHNWSDWGAIYAREACDINAPSDNVVLYGHHMADGSMFAQLETRYKRKSFWEEHQYLTFDTLYEHHTYQIIAVFRISVSLGQGFPYHQFNDAANKEEFDAFVAKIKELSLYDTGLTAEYGDKLLTLSTCEYTLTNGRFVVVAKRIS